MATKKNKPVPPAVARGDVSLARKPAVPHTRTTHSTAAHAPELSRDTSTAKPSLQSAAATSAPNNLKRSRKDNKEDGSETPSTSKRLRKDGRVSYHEDEQGEPQVPVDVQSYIAKRTQEIRAEVQKLGKSVMPPPPAERREWETDTLENARKIKELVSESKLLSLITHQLAKTKAMDEEGNHGEERRLLTPAEIDTWANTIYGELSKKEQEDVGWIKVNYTCDPPPEGGSLHTVLPEGEDKKKVDWPEEFAWIVWEAKKSFKIQPVKGKNSFWDWFEPPGDGFQPYNRQLIAKAKEKQVVKWMKENDQPFSWDKIRNYGPIPRGAGEQPKALNTWNDFHRWTAKKRFKDYSDKENPHWSASLVNPSPTHTHFLAHTARRFEVWKRLRTLDQFLDIRDVLGRQYRAGSEEARARARVLLDSMPDLEYIPREATSKKVSEESSEATPARRSTRISRSGAILPSGAWKWPKAGGHPENPGDDAG
ncbi:tRNA(His) guanylyltransferase [Venturia nashicola]|uniref:tRNA(His) guanylyltransferase n=1 Tax=Venturia nashicola TaxID=86259 RepID=A0A4Z1PLB3_9PEZI|nr:tRNA(His) guanylyltransferase [Venturia nashicola]